MNRLNSERRARVIDLLAKGATQLQIERSCDVSVNTTSKLLEEAGAVAAAHHDANVLDVHSDHVQVDQVWAYAAGAGDVWSWTGMDLDTRLIVSWHVGPRDLQNARAFFLDLGIRLADRAELTSDGVLMDPDAIKDVFARIYPGQLPQPCAAAGNGFDQRLRQHMALFCAGWNWCQVQRGTGKTPAMAAGLADVPYDTGFIAELVEQRTPKPGPRGPYRKRTRPNSMRRTQVA